MAARQRRFGIRVFLPLDELPTKVNESHLPDDNIVQRPPDFVTVRAPLYAIATQSYMLIDSKRWTQGLKKKVSKHRPVSSTLISDKLIIIIDRSYKAPFSNTS